MTATITLVVGILADLAIILYAFPAFKTSKRRSIGLIAYGAVCFFVTQVSMFIFEYAALLTIPGPYFEAYATVLDLLHILGIALTTTGVIMICNEFAPKTSDEVGEQKV